ncbi:MAG: TIGR04211 family SH3 domain-containing protein [Gammaproteobacteria bacterium]
MQRLLFICLLLGLPLSAHAETVFVIDQVEAGLYQGKTADSPILKLLPTGTALDVLQRDGERVQVRDPEGARGWIDNRYLMPTKPTRQLLNESEAARLELQRELEQLQASSNGGNAVRLNDEIAALKQALASAREQAAAEPDTKTTATRAVPDTMAGVILHKRTLWLLLASLLLLGIGIGAWCIDYLNRRRHGGFRV